MPDSTSGGYQMPDLSSFHSRVEEALDANTKTEKRNAGDSGGGRNVWHFYDMKEGSNRLFILPPWAGSNSPVLDIHRYKKGSLPAPANTRSKLCVSRTYPDLELDCPVLQTLQRLESKGHDVRDYWPKHSMYFNVIDMDGEEVEVKDRQRDGSVKTLTLDLRRHPQIMRVTPRVGNAILALQTAPQTSMFFDPNRAVGININFTPGQGSWYTVNPLTSIDPETAAQTVPRFPIHPEPDVVLDILDSMADLSKVFKAPLNDLKPDGALTLAAANLERQYLQAAGIDTDPTIVTVTPSAPRPAPAPPKPKADPAPPVPAPPVPGEVTDPPKVTDLVSSGACMPFPPETPASEPTPEPAKEEPTPEAAPEEAAPAPEDKPTPEPSALDAHLPSATETSKVQVSQVSIPGAPACWRKFGNPIEGLDCATCPMRAACEAVTKAAA